VVNSKRRERGVLGDRRNLIKRGELKVPRTKRDNNAKMRFVATDNDTNNPVKNTKNTKAVNALKKKLNSKK